MVLQSVYVISKSEYARDHYHLQLISGFDEQHLGQAGSLSHFHDLRCVQAHNPTEYIQV